MQITHVRFRLRCPAQHLDQQMYMLCDAQHVMSTVAVQQENFWRGACAHLSIFSPVLWLLMAMLMRRSFQAIANQNLRSPSRRCDVLANVCT